MERRFILFLLVSMLLVFGYSAMLQWLHPEMFEEPTKEDPTQVTSKDGEDPSNDPSQQDPDEPDEDEPQDTLQAVPEAEEAFVTLGSLDPESPYRMLVTLNNRGAILERAELTGAEYLTVEDRTDETSTPGGYLGWLQPETVKEQGVRVRVVGPGTPAERAGLEVGDLIYSLDGESLASRSTFYQLLARTQPGQEITLGIRRDGKEQELTVQLERYPLSVIQPSAPRNARRPFQMTLQALDERKLDKSRDLQELGDLNLYTAAWTIAEGATDSEVTFEIEPPGTDLRLSKTFRLNKADPEAEVPGYSLDVTISIENLHAEKSREVAYRLQGPNGLPTEGWWYTYKIGQAFFGGYGVRDAVVAYQEDGSPEVVAAREIWENTKNGKFSYWGDQGTLVKYTGVETQYFAAMMLPKRKSEDPAWLSWARGITVGAPPPDHLNLANTSVELASLSKELKPEEKLSHTYEVFLGPKKPDEVLSHYGLEELVYYGWFPWIVAPLISILDGLYVIVGNYGIAILLLTVLVRTCLLPISLRFTRQMQEYQDKMAKAQPELAKVKEKYKGDAQQAAIEQHKVLAKYGVNPLAMFGGCLMPLVQLPIFIGLFNALRIDINLRQAEFIPGLAWAASLGAPDMLFYWREYLYFDILVGPTGWLGPYFNILPIISAVLLWKQMQDQQKHQQAMAAPAENEQQEQMRQMQQTMMSWMPVMMGLFFFKMPAGLCLYFIATNLWSFGERRFIQSRKAKAEAESEGKEPGGGTKTLVEPSDGRPPSKGLLGSLMENIQQQKNGESEPSGKAAQVKAKRKARRKQR